MADKTTTLKTKTNDNVYPNVIGDNRDNAIVDSAHIKHTLTADHKINFRIDDNVSNLIFNSLQKPKGLTKTELVGVGANGQENIEIGDNLTLANGKLSASGGGGESSYINVLEGSEFTETNEGFEGTYTGIINDSKINILHIPSFGYFVITFSDNEIAISYVYIESNMIIILNNGKYTIKNLISNLYYHFVTMTNSADNIVLYFIIPNTTDNNSYDAYAIFHYLVNKKVLVNGNLHGVVPNYITQEDGIIKIYYMTPGDSNINLKHDEYQFKDLSSFIVTDLLYPVE